MALCKIGALMAPGRLTDTDHALMVRWLEDGTDSRGRRVSAVQMAHAVTVGAAVVGPTTLKDHRGGRCACYREKASA